MEPLGSPPVFLSISGRIEPGVSCIKINHRSGCGGVTRQRRSPGCALAGNCGGIAISPNAQLRGYSQVRIATTSDAIPTMAATGDQNCCVSRLLR